MHGPLTAWLVLFISLILTILAWFISTSYVKKRAQEKFEFKAIEITHAIQEQMLLYEQVLRAGVAFFDSSDHISRDEWKTYVEKLNLEKNWPGIQGLGFSIPIKPENLEKHIADVRSEGFPEFTVRPEGKRDLYTSIIYLEPFDWRNKRAFGFDMWSNKMRREAMTRAMNSGDAAASGLITLVQETDTDVQKGFLVYMPVYKKNLALNSNDRSDNILGWVYAAFRSGDLMQGIIQSRSAHLDNLTYMEIYDDKVSEDSLLYSSTNKGSKLSGSHKPLNSKEISMNIQGRKWILYIYEESNPDSKDSYLPWYIGIAGVIIDLLLFYVILSISSVQKRAVNLAKNIAGKIEEKNNELEVLNSELEANKNRITAIVDNTVDGIISINEQGIILSYNNACEKLFSYKREEVIGQNVKMLMPKSFNISETDFLNKFLNVSRGVGSEVDCLNKNGKTFPADFSLNLAHKSKDKVYVGVIRDITERKANEARMNLALEKLMNTKGELEKANKEAIASSKSKSEFLANMSHEIRTPMTAILGYIDLLKENENIKFTEALEQVKIIEKNGDHLLTIINDILDLSKIEAGKLELEYAPFCLYEMTCNLQNLLEAKVKEKSISLNVEIGYPVPQKVSGDLTRIRQILLNLLGNAIKFTHKGSVTLHLKWNPQISELSFDIIDTGIGMTPEQCEKIFNSFEQADTSITRTFGGTGLGLSITKRLIEMMHGHVSVESEYGKGSKFSVMIKVKASTDKLINQPPQVKTQIELKKTNGLQGHILLVDDNMTNLTLIGKILKKMNLEVECCMNGEEATKILLNSDNDFDLVLMDVQMPIMDGLTAASILKQNSYNKPVIALTANNMKGDKEKCLEAGYCDFASKPINRKELYKMLCEYLTPPE